MMVCIDTPPHLAMPDHPWMQKCWVICSWWGSAQLGQVEFDGVVDQAVDPQPVVGEVALEQRRVLHGVGVLAVVPEVGGDVLLGVLARGCVHVLEQALHRADQREADTLHQPGVAQGERGGGDPADDHHDHRGREDPQTSPALPVLCGVDVVEVAQQPRGERQGDVHHDEQQEPC
jgi:hypothetical protein